MPPDAPTHTRLADLPQDPFDLFAAWYERAEAAETVQYPGAMCLSTVDPDGRPRGRFVIAHRIDRAFVFLTDARSPKARALAVEPRTALTAYWGRPLELQIRIEGRVGEAASAVTDAIFSQRPRPSQATPWVSEQSEVTNLERLDERLRAFDRKSARSEALLRPDHWRGYRLDPESLEFWFARARRLHDRFLYRLGADRTWERTRLSP